MKKLNLTFAMLLLWAVSNAQIAKVEYGPEIKLDDLTWIKDIKCDDEGNIYVLRNFGRRRNEFSYEAYDKNLKLLFNKPLVNEKDKKLNYFSGIATLNNTSALYVGVVDKPLLAPGNLSYIGGDYNYQVLPVAGDGTVGDIIKGEDSEYKSDPDPFGARNYPIAKNSGQLISDNGTAFLYNRVGGTLYINKYDGKTISTWHGVDIKSQDYFFNSAEMSSTDKAGEYYLLVKLISINEDAEGEQYKLFLLNDKVTEVEIDGNGKTVQGAILAKNRAGKNLLAGTYKSSRGSKDVEGYFVTELTKGSSLSKIEYVKFNSALYARFYGKGPDKYCVNQSIFVQHVKENKDGSYTLAMRGRIIYKAVVEKKVIEAPLRLRFKGIFICNTKDGEENWGKYLPNEEYSMIDFMNRQGMAVSEKGDNLYLVFNDEDSNGNITGENGDKMQTLNEFDDEILVCVKVEPDGTLTKEMIAKHNGGDVNAHLFYYVKDKEGNIYTPGYAGVTTKILYYYGKKSKLMKISFPE